MLRVVDAAEYILELMAPKGRGASITTWKLQKLIYYAQAWSLVWDKKTLFPEHIEAWANGPVCPELYERHRGKYSVQQTDIEKKPRPPEPYQQLTILAVVQGYGERTGAELRDQAHRERPWKDARKGFKRGEPGNVEITPESMSRFYGNF